MIYLNSNKITLQLNTKFVKFNSLTSELLVFNLNDSFQCTSNVHEHSVFCGVVFLHPYFMSIAIDNVTESNSSFVHQISQVALVCLM